MPETRGQALEAIGESFLNHRSNVGSWAPVRMLRKLASRIGRRGTGSLSSSERSSVAGREERERPEVLEGTGEPCMSGALGEQTEEVVISVSPESPAGAMNSSEEEIELGILAIPAAA